MTLLSILISLCFAAIESVELKAAIAFRQSGRVCCPVRLSGEDAVGHLDTGSTSVVLEERDNDERFSGLPSQPVKVTTIDGQFRSRVYQQFPIEIFGQPLRLVNASRREPIVAGALGTSKISSIVGNIAFREDTLHIDIRHGIVERIKDLETGARMLDSQTRPLHWRQEVPWIAVELPIFGEHQVLLDTGSNAFVTLKPAFIEKLLRARQAVYLKESLAASPKGQKSVKMYCLRSLTLGGVEFQNVPVVPSEVETIGLGLLQHFEMILNFPGNQVTLSALDLDHTRFPVDASGLRVFFDNDRLIVYRVDSNSPAAAAGFLVDDQILEFAGRDPSTLWRHEIDETLARAGETIRIRIARGDVVQEIPLPLSRPYQYPPDWPPILPEFNPDPVRN